MTRILVTGGAGFIGSHLARYYQTSGAEVIVLDDFSTGHRSNLEQTDVRLVEGSILDRDLLRHACTGVDYVFHLAALISVVESMLDPQRCVEVNAIGTLNVLAAARDAGVRKVVFSSSAAVYGEDRLGDRHENELTRPMSPYGVTKLDGELYLEMARRAYGLETVSLRYFNVFGPRQDPRSEYSPVVASFIECALRGDDVVIYGDGRQTRDFVYVDDVVAANVLVAEKPDLVGVYNVGQGHGTTILDLAVTIIRLIGSTSRICHKAPRPGDITHSVANMTRLREAGYCNTTALESGLRSTIESFRRSRPEFEGQQIR